MPVRQLPVITTVPGEVSWTEVRLGPKNGYVHVFVEDAQDRAVKDDVRLILSRADSPELLEKAISGGRAFVAVPEFL